MNDPEPVSNAAAPAAHAGQQETDVWWGAYSAWTLLPSTAVCVAMTAVLAWTAWMFAEPSHVRLLVGTLGGALWLIQGVRCWRRVFGYSYRLTTRRLLVIHGHFWSVRYQVDLAEIDGVRARRNSTVGWLGIGTLVILTRHKNKLILEGVRRPAEVAQRIQSARERATKM